MQCEPVPGRLERPHRPEGPAVAAARQAVLPMATALLRAHHGLPAVLQPRLLLLLFLLLRQRRQRQLQRPQPDGLLPLPVAAGGGGVGGAGGQEGVPHRRARPRGRKDVAEEDGGNQGVVHRHQGETLLSH